MYITSPEVLAEPYDLGLSNESIIALLGIYFFLIRELLIMDGNMTCIEQMLTRNV